MNRLDFERKVRGINPRFGVTLRRGTFLLTDRDRYNRPYVALEIKGRCPTPLDVLKVRRGEKVKRNGDFLREILRLRESNESKDAEVRRMRRYELLEKSKDFAGIVGRLADEDGAPAVHNPTAAEDGWSGRVV